MNRLVILVALGWIAGCGRSSPSLPGGSDEERRGRLLARIGNINDFSQPRPLVTLEEFFEGNNDPGSIGYNLLDPPEPREFYILLLEIRKRPGVGDVRIEIKQLEDPKDWPCTDTIWVITTASLPEVRSWFPKRLAPSELMEGLEASPYSVENYSVPKGMRAVRVWYH